MNIGHSENPIRNSEQSKEFTRKQTIGLDHYFLYEFGSRSSHKTSLFEARLTSSKPQIRCIIKENWKNLILGKFVKFNFSVIRHWMVILLSKIYGRHFFVESLKGFKSEGFRGMLMSYWTTTTTDHQMKLSVRHNINKLNNMVLIKT